jgi:hypothetical protein
LTAVDAADSVLILRVHFESILLASASAGCQLKACAMTQTNHAIWKDGHGAS